MTTRFTGEDPDFGTTSEDMDAINDYMTTTQAVTPAAQQIVRDWMTWWNGLNFIDKMSDAKYDEARSRRNAFWLANATTAAQKANVVNVMTTGITTEEMQGKARPSTDPKTGVVNGRVPSKVSSSNSSTTGTTVNHATIRQGSKGADVKAWQAIIGVPADGSFGPQTAMATKKWQSDHGLTADGVVGPQTWGAAIPSTGTAANAVFNPVANPDLILPKPAAKTATATAAKTAAATQAVVAPLVNPSILSGAGTKAKVAAASVVGNLDVSKWGWKQWLLALGASTGLALGGKALMKHHETSARRG